MWDDNETERDLIGFQRFADAVVSLVTEEAILPVTVGLFGDWGGGKSSVLRMMEKQLVDRNGVLTLRFDGWLFEGYDDAKAALMTSILQDLTDHIKKDEPLWARLGPKATGLLRRIDWFRVVGLAARGILTITSPAAGAAAVGVLTVDKAIGFLRTQAEDASDFDEIVRGLIKDDTADGEAIHESIRQFRDEFASLLADSDIGTLVVLIDDLDRCVPESIVSTLEAIKLFLAVPGTAFVIAADERIVRDAISRRYPPEAYAEFDIAQEYLDKLVQVPCTIPPMNQVETETYIYLLFAERCLARESFEGLCEHVRENRKNPSLPQPLNFGIARTCLAQEADQLEVDFALAERLSPILGLNLRGNPRLVKRFLNALSLRLRLGEVEGMELDQGVLAKLMVLERFHEERFRQLDLWQASQDGLPAELSRLEVVAKASESVGDADELSDVLPWLDDPDLLAWLQMEPSLTDTNLSPYFRLARESLGVTVSGGRRLSQEQQELFASLVSGSEAAAKRAGKTLAGMPAGDIFPVYDAVWVRVKANPKGTKALDALVWLSYEHEGVGKRLLRDMQALSPASIAPRIVPMLAEMRQYHPQLEEGVNDQLSKWSQCGQPSVARVAAAVMRVT